MNLFVIRLKYLSNDKVFSEILLFQKLLGNIKNRILSMIYGEDSL